MNVCVCGWYGRQFDEFYMTLYKVHKKHPVHVIAKRDDTFWDDMALPYTVIPNIGLEWAAYQFFLEHSWDGLSDTLFTHDDVELLPIIQNHETVQPETLFDELAKLDYDQAYLFGNRAEDVFYVGRHGRAIFVSAGVMGFLKINGGIWFDPYNNGYTGGKKPEGPMLHYNAGTDAFFEKMKQAKQVGFNTCNKVYVPAWRMGYRGQMKNVEEML